MICFIHILLSNHYDNPNGSRYYQLQLINEVTDSGRSSDLLKFIQLVNDSSNRNLGLPGESLCSFSNNNLCLGAIKQDTNTKTKRAWIKPRTMELLSHVLTTCPWWQLIALGFSSIRPCQDKSQEADATYRLVSLVRWSRSKSVIICSESRGSIEKWTLASNYSWNRTDMRTQSLTDHCLELWLHERTFQARTWQVIFFIPGWAIETEWWIV